MQHSISKTPLHSPADDEIPLLLDELEQSGESVAAFARGRGLSTWKLYRAKRKRVAASEEQGFAEVRIAPAVAAPDPLEVVVPSGFSVRVRPGFDEGALSRLLEVLKSC